MTTFYVPANQAESILASGITNVSTTITVDTGDGAEFPSTFPFIIWIDSEAILITNRVADAMTTTVALRGFDGTAAAAHDAAASVKLNVSAKYVSGAYDILQDVLWLLGHTHGRANGVYRDQQEPTSLKVVANVVPDMKIKVQDGYGWLDDDYMKVATDTQSDTMIAPVGNPRIDLVQLLRNTGAVDSIYIKAGAEGGAPSAPAQDSDTIVLATIYHYVGETSIKDADDGSNGYITDMRGSATYTQQFL